MDGINRSSVDDQNPLLVKLLNKTQQELDETQQEINTLTKEIATMADKFFVDFVKSRPLSFESAKTQTVEDYRDLTIQKLVTRYMNRIKSDKIFTDDWDAYIQKIEADFREDFAKCYYAHMDQKLFHLTDVNKTMPPSKDIRIERKEIHNSIIEKALEPLLKTMQTAAIFNAFVKLQETQQEIDSLTKKIATMADKFFVDFVKSRPLSPKSAKIQTVGDYRDLTIEELVTSYMNRIKSDAIFADDWDAYVLKIEADFREDFAKCYYAHMDQKLSHLTDVNKTMPPSKDIRIERKEIHNSIIEKALKPLLEAIQTAAIDKAFESLGE